VHFQLSSSLTFSRHRYWTKFGHAKTHLVASNCDTACSEDNVLFEKWSDSKAGYRAL